MRLVIAEKPSVGAEIASVLGANTNKKNYREGNGYVVSWCVGHLMEFSKPEGYDEKYQKHYIDASLIEAMECAGNDSKSCVGIGTQATRALMIEKIIKSGYVERKGKNLIPTEMGKKLIEIVPEEVRSANMTAEWEEKLHLIEHGEYSASNFMNDITAFVMDMVKKYKGGKYE